jgi:hypothetical protein
MLLCELNLIQKFSGSLRRISSHSELPLTVIIQCSPVSTLQKRSAKKRKRLNKIIEVQKLPHTLTYCRSNFFRKYSLTNSRRAAMRACCRSMSAYDIWAPTIISAAPTRNKQPLVASCFGGKCHAIYCTGPRLRRSQVLQVSESEPNPDSSSPRQCHQSP